MIAIGLVNIAVFVGGVYLPTLDTVANFAPGLLAIGLVVWLIVYFVGARRLALAAFIVTTLPPALAIGTDLLGAVYFPPPEHVSRLKIVTINLWSRNLDLPAAERLIWREKPQVLLLQEVSSKHDRQLLDRLETLYPTHVSNQALNCSTHVLSAYPLAGESALRDCNLVTARLALSPEFGGGELLVASVHMTRDSSAQVTEIGTLMTRWAKRSAIVGGDFNRTPWSWSLRRFDEIKGFDRRTHALPTWPTQLRARETWLTMPFAVLPLDHVFATRDWRTVSVRRGPEVGSDHYPIIVELTRLAS